MKAIIYEEFGPPEVLQIQDVAQPSPKEDEVLIRIYATTVCAEDPGARSSPGLNGIFKPKNPILGWYLAGEVAGIGKKVKRFKVGDAVYGSAGSRLGTYAEFICLSEDAALAIKPSNLTFEEAAAIPNGALTALPFLRDHGKVQRGQAVLVNGASGTVGIAGVQFARYYGATVTGVCSTSNLELVKSLGADRVLDYTREDFTQTGDSYDVIFDAVAKRSFTVCKPALKPGGIYLTTFPNPTALRQRFFPPRAGQKRASFAATGLRKGSDKAQDLDFIRGLIEAGEIKPVIDRIYPMDEIVEAHKYVETGRKKGDVVIQII